MTTSFQNLPNAIDDADFLPRQVLRDGIPVEKGIEVTTTFLDKNEKLIEKYLNFWMLYPDCE